MFGADFSNQELKCRNIWLDMAHPFSILHNIRCFVPPLNFAVYIFEFYSILVFDYILNYWVSPNERLESGWFLFFNKTVVSQIGCSLGWFVFQVRFRDIYNGKNIWSANGRSPIVGYIIVRNLVLFASADSLWVVANAVRVWQLKLTYQP